MGTCDQPGYVFRDFCLKQGIDFIIFCLNQGIDFINSVWFRVKCLKQGIKTRNQRPLALRGHVTNVSFKQLVVILLMPKIDRAHKNHLTPEI